MDKKYQTPVSKVDFAKIEKIAQLAKELKDTVDNFCKKGACNWCPIDRVDNCNQYADLAKINPQEDYEIYKEEIEVKSKKCRDCKVQNICYGKESFESPCFDCLYYTQEDASLICDDCYFDDECHFTVSEV